MAKQIEHWKQMKVTLQFAFSMYPYKPLSGIPVKTMLSDHSEPTGMGGTGRFMNDKDDQYSATNVTAWSI